MSHEAPAESEVQLTKAVVKALLRTQGYVSAEQVLAPGRRSRLAEDVRRMAEARRFAADPGGVSRAVVLLSYSDSALELLDDEVLGAWVDEALGDDAILSRAEAVIAPAGGPAGWQSDFAAPRRGLPARAFRPGVAVWSPLDDTGGLEVLRASQHLDGDAPAEDSGLPSVRLEVAGGDAVILEGGVTYRLLTPGTRWLCLAFARPWIKPEVLFSAALSAARLAGLGERGRRWCGAHLGLPTSVEEFLAIEEAAVDGDFGRAKGSGI